jgi:hypothetical protein
MLRALAYSIVVAVALAAAMPGHGQTTQVAQAKSSESELQMEMLFWETIKDSTDPADYQAYLDTYPKGRFAALARARLKRHAGPTSGAAPATAAPAAPATPAVPATTGDKPVYVPRAARGASATTGPSSQAPRTYVARVRAFVYKGPSVRTAKTGEFFVENESFKVIDVVAGGDWLKVITRTGKEGYVFANQARASGTSDRGSLFINPSQQPTQ